MTQALTRLRGHLSGLDLLAAAFLTGGLACLASGLLPVGRGLDTVGRIVPLLIFLGAVIVLAELTAEAGVFDAIARRIAIVAGGRFLTLFLLCGLFATLTTVTLNLDTTAVLLTPVMIAMAAQIGVPRMPLAMTTVWLANTASLLLPMSNLTNLLAGDRLGLDPPAFARRMLLAQVFSVVATMACLWLFYWRRGARGMDRYQPPAPAPVRDPALFRAAALACAGFVVGVLAGLPLGVTTFVAAAVVVVAFLLRRPASLRRWRLIPVQLLAFVTGLFLVVETVSRLGLGRLLGALVGDDGGTVGVLRGVGTGAGLSNLINNLPAYVAVESAVPAGNVDQLLGVLLGTNVGPIVMPWASLATLLWYERCRSAGVDVSWGRFIRTGLVTAVLALLAATAGLLLGWTDVAFIHQARRALEVRP